MKAKFLFILLSLSGCAGGAGRIGSPTMEADPALIGAEGLALQAELSLAYTNVRPTVVNGDGVTIPDSELCRYLLPSYQERGAYPYMRHEEAAPRRGRSAAEQFQCHYLVPNPTAAQVRRHVEAGLALSDLYCDIYFRRIARRWNERLFLRNTTNDVGAAVSAILGLAAAGSGVTGGISAAFALADSSFRNYDNVFVVSPDLPAMRRLVHEHQQQMRTEIAATTLTGYADAQRRIVEYAGLCSYLGMRGLLNLAVDQNINALSGAEAIRSAAVGGATRRERQLLEIERARADLAEQMRAERDRQRAAEDDRTQSNNM